MIVVSDSTPIISLAKIDMLEVLGKLYKEIVLPHAVHDEVCRNPNFAIESKAIQACTFIRVETVNNLQSY